MNNSSDFGKLASTVLNNTKIVLKCKTDGQKRLLKSIKDKEITIAAGPAGSGKTYIACAESLKLLKSNNNKYESITIVKSVTTLKDEEIGFLKGNMEEKMEPFMYSFIHNFEKIIKNKSVLTKLRNEDIINILPVAYMRGINLDNTIVIIDEVQNLTHEHLITILTRLGSNSKMILLGDTDQIDIKNKRNSGLKWLIKTFKDFTEIGIVELTSEDVVRNKLVSKIIDHLNNINEDK